MIIIILKTEDVRDIQSDFQARKRMEIIIKSHGKTMEILGKSCKIEGMKSIWIFNTFSSSTNVL